MMIKARKMIRALTIEERTKELKNVYSANDNLKVWKGIKSRLSDKQIDTVIQLRGINHNEFNNVIQNLDEINDEQTLQKLDDIVENSNWFKTFNEIMNMDMSIPADYINSDLRLCLTNFVKWGIGRIYTVTEQFDNITIDTGVYREIEKYLYDSLFSLAAKVLVYKFNKEKNNNKEGRYTIKRFIIEKFTNYKEVENFYCDYPVLARRLSTKIDYISNNIIRMLENINDNFEVISDIYKLGTTKITSVNCGKGDTHNKGNSVCILRIGNTEIVYKPYRDELGKRYNQFIETYNKYVDYQKIYVQKNVYFKDFTVCEYIHNKQCEDK